MYLYSTASGKPKNRWRRCSASTRSMAPIAHSVSSTTCAKVVREYPMLDGMNPMFGAELGVRIRFAQRDESSGTRVRELIARRAATTLRCGPRRSDGSDTRARDRRPAVHRGLSADTIRMPLSRNELRRKCPAAQSQEWD